MFNQTKMRTAIIALVITSSAISLFAADHPRVEALARDYLTAVRTRDLESLRALFTPVAIFTRSEKERRYVEEQWIRAASTDLPKSIRIEVTLFAANPIHVHPPWRWPIQPTHRIRIASGTGEHRETLEAAVEIAGHFYLIRPLPPEDQMK